MEIQPMTDAERADRAKVFEAERRCVIALDAILEGDLALARTVLALYRPSPTQKERER